MAIPAGTGVLMIDTPWPLLPSLVQVGVIATPPETVARSPGAEVMVVWLCDEFSSTVRWRWWVPFFSRIVRGGGSPGYAI